MIARIAIVSFFLFYSVATGYALPVSGDTVSVANGKYGTTAGGEFIVTTSGAGGNHSFTTFCLEYNEHISYNGTYFVDTVSDYATLGGGGAVNGRDQLSDATKWLYWNYLQGVYGFSDSVANKVQKSIWTLENENWNSTTNIATFASRNFFQNILGQADYTIDGDVKVLNIVDANGNPKQSQIIAESVPEPASMLLFGTGLTGIALAGRRRKK